MEYVIYPIVGSLAIIIIIVIVVLMRSGTKIEKAIAYINAEDYKTAMKVLKRIVNSKPDDHIAHYYLGIAYKGSEMWEWALNEFRRVISLQKFDINIKETAIRDNIAEIYLKIGQAKEALKELLLNAKDEQNNHLTFYKLGIIYINLNNHEQAINYLLKANSLNSDHADTINALGTSYYELKRYVDAKNHLELAIKKKPNLFKSHYYLGMIYMQSENYSKAIFEFELAMRENDLRLYSFSL